MTNDPVEHPTHYASHPSGIECVDLTEHMNFNLGNAFKYLWRRDQKSDAVEDLKKARWYLQREASRIKRAMIAHIDRFNTFSAVEPEGNVLTAMHAIFSGHINLELLTSCEHAIRHIDAELQKRGAA